MSVSSREGMSLVPCSEQRKAEKHVVIYYHEYDAKVGMRNYLACVSVGSMIPPFEANIARMISELELPRSEDNYLNCSMSCICTVGKSRPGRLYFFGGLDPPLGSPLAPLESVRVQNEYVVHKVYRYDLRNKLPKKVGDMVPCKDMIYGMRKPLLVQVGDDCIYVLNYGKIQFSDSLTPAFQEYNFKKNKWSLLDDDGIINKSDCDERTREELNEVPHVVIGQKLHISIGNSSFTFDADNGVWEDCKLFETFWSKSGLSPLNFYGLEVWFGAVSFEAEKKKRKRKREEVGKFGGGPPFGFHGRGILWDKNILLGVHFAENCPMVAFLLDDKGDKVVKSQPVSLNGLDLEEDSLEYNARLVDLGREDGYFGLVHFVPGNREHGRCTCYWGPTDIEVVTFKVWRPQKVAAAPDDDHFLECQVVGREIVVKDCSESCDILYNAFCV